jgi:hypothetical protein
MEPAYELGGSVHRPIPAVHNAVQVEDDHPQAMRTAGPGHGTDDRALRARHSVPRMLFPALTALYDAAAFGPGQPPC